jgi:lysozyme family protein
MARARAGHVGFTRKLRSTLRAAANTLRRRAAVTPDARERRTLGTLAARLARSAGGRRALTPLEVGTNAADVVQTLERAVAAARIGPFGGHLTAVQRHLRALHRLSGAIHRRDALPPAPADEASFRRARVRVFSAEPIADGVNAPRPLKDFAQLADEYRVYWDACTPRKECQENVKYYAKRLADGRKAYEQAAAAMGGMPWAFIGVIHGMECGFDFAGHLHNGDPLTVRTVHVPAGRPSTGAPPFTWHESALDALTGRGFRTVTDWSVPHMLFLLEKYNGFGYRARRVPTPYLWSFSNLYKSGKFVADGRFSAKAVSRQCGAALMLKAVLSSSPGTGERVGVRGRGLG